MKHLNTIVILLLFASSAAASGMAVPYVVDGAPFEGYYISPAANAPLVLLIHDWDGLTDYEVKRANMLCGFRLCCICGRLVRRRYQAH